MSTSLFRNAQIAKNPLVISRNLRDEVGGIWERALPEIRDGLKKSLENGLVQGLYYTQQSTASLTSWLDRNPHREMACELASLFLMAFERLGSYSLFPVRDGSRASALTKNIAMKRAVRTWLPRNSNGNENTFENLIANTQFLYGSVRVLRMLCRADLAHARYESEAWPVIVDHVERWIGSTGYFGLFQVAGWGCTKGNFTHTVHLENLQRRVYRSASAAKKRDLPREYCNALTDIDIFIGMICFEVLALNLRDKMRFPLLDSNDQMIADHARLFVSLLKDRFVRSTVLDWEGKNRAARILDPGLWDNHPSHAYSGDTDPTFPGFSEQGAKVVRLPNRVSGTGWDLSHSRRFVLLLETFEDGSPGFVSKAISPEFKKEVAMQLIFGPWNGDADRPRFSNYIDGSRGWYRVNYENRPRFGIAPGDLDAQFVAAGFPIIASYDASAARLIRARLHMQFNGVESLATSHSNTRRLMEVCSALASGESF